MPTHLARGPSARRRARPQTSVGGRPCGSLRITHRPGRSTPPAMAATVSKPKRCRTSRRWFPPWSRARPGGPRCRSAPAFARAAAERRPDRGVLVGAQHREVPAGTPPRRLRGRAAGGEDPTQRAPVPPQDARQVGDERQHAGAARQQRRYHGRARQRPRPHAGRVPHGDTGDRPIELGHVHRCVRHGGAQSRAGHRFGEARSCDRVGEGTPPARLVAEQDPLGWLIGEGPCQHGRRSRYVVLAQQPHRRHTPSFVARRPGTAAMRMGGGVEGAGVALHRSLLRARVGAPVGMGQAVRRGGRPRRPGG
jgi:hypothetical protein